MRFSLDPDSKFMQTLNRLCDLAVLNLVFLLTCLPIFTIGAANAALYTVVFRMDTEKEGALLRTYFRAFKENFRQGTVLTLFFLFFGAASFVNLQYFSQFGGIFGYLLKIASVGTLVVLALVFSYAFPLVSQFCNSTPGTLRNALLLSIAYLPRSGVLLAANCFPWALMFMNLYAFLNISLLWLFLYFAAAAYFNSRVLRKVFQPYWEKA